MTTCGGCHFSFLGPFASNATPRSTMPADDVHDGWVASAAESRETLCEFTDSRNMRISSTSNRVSTSANASFTVVRLPESATTQLHYGPSGKSLDPEITTLIQHPSPGRFIPALSLNLGRSSSRHPWASSASVLLDLLGCPGSLPAPCVYQKHTDIANLSREARFRYNSKLAWEMNQDGSLRDAPHPVNLAFKV
jgi:hypothetical protein